VLFRSELTVENVLANPKAFGFPTVQEFARNPDKYRDTLNAKMGRLDQSTQTFKHLVERQTYKIAGFEVKTLEEVERIAKGEGIDLKGCKFCPQVIPTVGGKCRIVIEFRATTLSRILDAMGSPFRK
jgi:hypothetical protein